MTRPYVEVRTQLTPVLAEEAYRRCQRFPDGFVCRSRKAARERGDLEARLKDAKDPRP